MVDSASMVSAVAVASPVLVSAGSYQTSVHSGQSSAIVLNTAPDWYSEELDAAALKEITDFQPYNKLGNGSLHYMGSKGSFHFLAHQEQLALTRKVYRIRKSEYEIQQTFNLTTQRKLWRQIPQTEFPVNPAQVFGLFDGERLILNQGETISPFDRDFDIGHANSELKLQPFDQTINEDL